MSCALCHNFYDARGMYDTDTYMAGGVAITIPASEFSNAQHYLRQKTGIGDWTEDKLCVR